MICTLASTKFASLMSEFATSFMVRADIGVGISENNKFVVIHKKSHKSTSISHSSILKN